MYSGHYYRRQFDVVSHYAVTHFREIYAPHRMHRQTDRPDVATLECLS